MWSAYCIVDGGTPFYDGATKAPPSSFHQHYLVQLFHRYCTNALHSAYYWVLGSRLSDGAAAAVIILEAMAKQASKLPVPRTRTGESGVCCQKGVDGGGLGGVGRDSQSNT